MKKEIDVAIIGGGPAGLTAALTLGRSGRSVHVYDNEQGRNAPAEHMMNFPSRDGTPPLEFRKLIKDDLKNYNEISFSNETVETIQEKNGVFLINNNLFAKKILLAHGVKDILPKIEGVKEAWGKNIFSCPYCHGHEFKNKKIAVIADFPHYADHMIPLLLGLSNNVSILTNQSNIEIPEPLLKHVTIYSEKIITYKNNFISFSSGKKIYADCLVIKPPQKLSSEIGINLGCKLTETGHYQVDAFNMTNVFGVYTAGDAMTARQSVLNACADGQKAASFINFALLSEKYLPAKN